MKRTLLLLSLFFCAFSMAQYNESAPWMQQLKRNRIANYQPTFQEVQKAFNDYWSTRDHKAKGSGYKPFKRWEYIWETVADEEGYLPTSKDKWEAWQHKNEMQSGMGSVDLSNWQALGPVTHTNTGSWSSGQARINAIAVDPNDANTWYIGAPAGGLWKSTNAGASWATTTDDLPQIGVSGIAIDPANSNIIYIATGDDDASDTASAGVFKSTDGGANWSQTGLNPETTPSSMNDIYIHPSNSSILWVATSSGVLKTTDAGATWTNMLSGNIKDIKLKPGDPNTLYAVTSDQFYRSTNGGDSFSLVTNGVPAGGGRMVIDVTPANAEYVYILSATTSWAFQGVYLSTNSGVSFSARNTTTDVLESTQAWYDLALGVSQTNAQEIYVGCLNVWKSSNGGLTFTKLNSWSNPSGASYTHADIHMIRSFNVPGMTNRMFVCSDGGIYSSTNGGTNFTDHTAGVQASQFYKIAVSPSNVNKMVGGLQDNGGHAYNNGNGNWQNYYGADGMDTAIDPNNDNKYYGFVQNGGGLYISSTAGASSTGYAGAPSGASGNWVTPLAMNSSGQLFAGYNRLYRLNASENGWITLADLGSSASLIEIAPSDDTRMYISVGAVLKRSDNTGSSVTDVYTFGSSIKGIAVDDTDPNIVWATTNSGVFRSDDGGNTFANITGNLPVSDRYMFLNDIVHHAGHPQDPIYVGTSLGVYRTVTGGSWTLFSNGLPTTIVTDLELNATDGSITAATYGRGIWRSSIPNCTTITATQELAIDSGTLESETSADLCTGQSITLKVNDTSGSSPTFSWTGPNGYANTGDTISINDLAIEQAGEYVVTMDSPSTCGAAEFSFTIELEEALQPTASDATTCANTSTTLVATGSTDYKWYAAETGGSEIATGASFTTPSLSANTTYYVAGASAPIVSEATPSPGVNTAADYNNNAGLLFDTNDDILLESFTMSAIQAGIRLIEVRNSLGDLVASTNVNIPAGESLVTVNFNIPKGDNYLIQIPSGLVQMRRTPVGNGVSYPYTSPNNIVSIVGNTFNAPDFYYFFYDWNFTSKGGQCESARTPVAVAVNADNPDLSDGDTTFAIDGGAVTPFNSGETITVNEGSDLVLDLPASAFSGTLLWTSPSAATFTTNSVALSSLQDNGAEEGAWTVAVTFDPNCGTATQTIDFNLAIDGTFSIGEDAIEGFEMYPNPVSETLTLRAAIPLDDSRVQIIDLSGRQLTQDVSMSNQGVNAITVNVSSLSNGVYFVALEANGSRVIRKLVKE